MIGILVVIIALSAVITEFFSVLWGWIILALPSAFLLWTLFALKRCKWRSSPELSEAANQMYQKFGHYYEMPSAAVEFSSSASALMFAGLAIAIIGAFKGFWWGIGIGILNWYLMFFVSRAFNPTNFFHHRYHRYHGAPIDPLAHEEIISWIQKRQKSGDGNA